MSNLLPKDLEIICNAVCGYFQIKPKTLMSRNRTAAVSEARHIVFHVLVKVAGVTNSSAARALGRRPNAATNSLKLVADVMTVDEKFRGVVNHLEERCRLLLKGEQ